MDKPICYAEEVGRIVTCLGPQPAGKYQCGPCGFFQARLKERQDKLGSAALLWQRDDLTWQADLGDSHAIGRTKGEALIELGLFIQRQGARK